MSQTNTSSSLTLLAIDTLLTTLQQLPFYADYVVRGSYVSRQWMQPYPRQCHDLDLLYLHDYQPKQLIAHVTQMTKQTADTIGSFDASQITYEEIWQDSLSPGMRFQLPYQVNQQNAVLQLDLACGDPLVSEPIEQTINGVTFQTVSLETLAAWKLHGLFEHLNGPWQSKTLWDLYLFCRYNTLDKEHFIQATELAFSSRLDPLVIINRLLQGDFGRSKKSKKYWQRDFATFTSAPFVPIDDVLQWLRHYLTPLFTLESDKPLFTLADIIRYRVNHLRSMTTQQTAVRQKLQTLRQKRKILPHKAYNTIHHLPTSRLGTSERCISARQNDLLTNPDFQQAGNIIIVQEKLDGSCVCAYRKDNELFALGRAGDLADHSANESRRLWASWVADNEARFMAILQDGERLCGEWLAMVHGTHYTLPHEPFVAFDLFTADNRALTYTDFRARIDHAKAYFIAPYLIHYGKEPCHLEDALQRLGNGHHGSTDKPEGLIWRLERNQRLAFKAKYVRHDKEDGCYLTEKTGLPEQWNWHKESSLS